MSIKEMILSRLNDPDYFPLTLPELLAQLELDGIDSYHGEKAIRTLEREHRLTFSKKGKLLPLSASPIREGIFRCTVRGFGFADVTEEDGSISTYFIREKERRFAIHEDKVLLRILSAPKDGKEGEAKIEKILSHTVTEFLGTVGKKKFYNKKKKPQWILLPDDRRIEKEVEIDLHGSVPFRDSDKVLVSVTAYPGPFCGLRGKVIRCFGKSNSKKANYESILYQNGIPLKFPKEVLTDAQASAQREILPENRLDLRGDHPYGVIFTIDGEDAKDLDDAISICKTEQGNYLLGVHIADVSEYVPTHSPCDKEALARGCSVYFTDQVIPMLPPDLSNGSCSLHTGVDRYALSAFMEIDHTGAIRSFDCKESILQTKIRGIYSEVNDLLDRGEYSPFYEKYALLFPHTLPLLQELYEILAQKSQRRGMLELETAEAKILLNEEGYPTEIFPREMGRAEKMIEQFMLCANEAVATFCHKNNLPCVYRIHEVPPQEKLQAFSLFASQSGLTVAGLSTDPEQVTPQQMRNVLEQAKEKGVGAPISMMMLRSLSKAKYAASRSLHFGLGIENYCHFTSPIRRYPDLSVHRILKAYLKTGLTEAERKRFLGFAQKSAVCSSENELRTLTAERQIEELYKIFYLQQFIGKEWEGSVSGITPFGVFVRLDNTCEGLIPLSAFEDYPIYSETTCSLQAGRTVYHLADRIRVRLMDADPDTRKVTFYPARELRKEKKA